MSKRRYRTLQPHPNDWTFEVYPSLIIAKGPQGRTVNIDVGTLYAMVAVHQRQNGAWAILDLDDPIYNGLRDAFIWEDYRR